MNSELCRERILSESYRDFISSETRPLSFGDIPPEELCAQAADFGYHCVYVPESVGPADLNRFLYSSIPHCYALLSIEALTQAGITPIQNYPTLQLKGQGVLIGFVDTGIDYTNPAFRSLDGTTRITGIWDQTVQSGSMPPDLSYGTEYTSEMLNEALRLEMPLSLVPTADENGHGTFLAGLAAGSGNANEDFLGAAPEASLAVVKLKQAKQYLKDYYFIPPNVPCYQENDILLGLKYLSDLAARKNLPLVLCIALGTNMGGHISLLPLSDVIEQYSTARNRIPVIGVGNEADKRHHYLQEFQSDSPENTVEIRVGEDVLGFAMEFWTDIPNIFAISLISPSGENTSRIPLNVNASSTYNFIFEKTILTVNYRLPVERSTSELIFFQLKDPTPGIWRLVAEPIRVISGQYHIWLPVTEFLSGEVYFLNSNPYYTLTSPANTRSTVVVSYYDGNNNSVALSSGRGYTRSEQINPDITAPGINVKSALPNDRFAVRSGSSISTGITAGAVALLVEWVIYQQGASGIDAFQIKSLLILGASRPDFMNYPNREWGYGQLNLYNTFDELRRFR